MSLSEFVKNKRLIVVGPAPYLQGKNFGEVIDSFDLIIRPNQFHVPKNLLNDYGSRTDIMSHNFGTEWMKGLKEDIENNKDQYDNLKMLMCPVLYGTRGTEEDYMSWPEDRVGDVVRNAVSVNTNKIPFHWIGPKRYQKLFRDVGCQPYSGVSTICMLLDCDIASLHLTGFDFYETSNVYAEGFHNPTQGPPPPQGGGHGHALEQARYLRHVFQSSNNFYIDDKMKTIFERC